MKNVNQKIENVIINSEKITDRDIFEYIKKSMIEQDKKSMDDYFDDDSQEVFYGETGQYFSFDYDKEISVRCALGFVMDPKLFTEYGEEETDASDTDILKVIAGSNTNWKITSNSWSMLALLQRIHDRIELEDWPVVMHRMTYLFNSDGDFDFSVINETACTERFEKFKSQAEIVNVNFEELGIVIEGLQSPDSSLVDHVGMLLENYENEEFIPLINIPVNIMEVETKTQFEKNDNLMDEFINSINNYTSNKAQKVEVQ